MPILTAKHIQKGQEHRFLLVRFLRHMSLALIVVTLVHELLEIVTQRAGTQLVIWHSANRQNFAGELNSAQSVTE